MPTRRRLLALLGVASVPFAGCGERERRTPGTADDPPDAFGTPLNDTVTGRDRPGAPTRTATATPTESTPENATVPSNRTGNRTENETGNRSTVARTGVENGTGTAAPTPGLDLREANVVAVDWDVTNGVYQFDVTLYHDDDGEAGYADRWQIESPNGTVLGRRELRHSHGTREFTRSLSLELPEGVSCVVVRGHDRTHGFGGRAVVVNLSEGTTTPVEQGPTADPDVAEGIC
jgi:hypothetical protein